jgi:iron complex transport system permease protein
MRVRKPIALFVFLTLALGILAICSLSIGSVSVANPWQVIFNPTLTGVEHQIIWQIRFPRILAALLVGAALGIAGALAQAATNNPLADPSIIGTSAGAALGASIVIVLNIASVGSLVATSAAVVGALLASLATISLSRSALQLVIIGIATSALLNALVGLVISIADVPEARSISFWSFGSLALADTQSVQIMAPLLSITICLGWYYAKHLDLLVLGERAVSHLGKDSKKLRLGAFLLISILIATSVSTVGAISFLALAAPHIARALLGPKNRPLLIGSALVGAGLLLIADTAARSIAPPNELPIGLISALIGAPILIFVLRKGSEVWR